MRPSSQATVHDAANDRCQVALVVDTSSVADKNGTLAAINKAIHDLHLAPRLLEARRYSGRF